MTEYRICKYFAFGYEPQMKSTMGAKDGTEWFPLNEAGYWLEPEAFNHGHITRHLVFVKREDAERAIIRARSINLENLKEVAKD